MSTFRGPSGANLAYHWAASWVACWQPMVSAWMLSGHWAIGMACHSRSCIWLFSARNAAVPAPPALRAGFIVSVELSQQRARGW